MLTPTRKVPLEISVGDINEAGTVQTIACDDTAMGSRKVPLTTQRLKATDCLKPVPRRVITVSSLPVITLGETADTEAEGTKLKYTKLLTTANGLISLFPIPLIVDVTADREPTVAPDKLRVTLVGPAWPSVTAGTVQVAEVGEITYANVVTTAGSEAEVEARAGTEAVAVFIKNTQTLSEYPTKLEPMRVILNPPVTGPNAGEISDSDTGTS